jgi:hypothetical protein
MFFIDLYLTFFSRWKGQLVGASVAWAVPTAFGVKVFSSLKENVSVMTFEKTGSFYKEEKLDYAAIDGGDFYILLRDILRIFYEIIISVASEEMQKLLIATETMVKELHIE